MFIEDTLQNINLDIASAIINYRNTHNLTIRDLGEILGISHSTVSRIENGKYVLTLKQLCHICDCINYALEIKLYPFNEVE